MFRRIARVSAPFSLTAFAAVSWVFGGCRDSDVTIAFANDAGASSFSNPDAGVVEAGIELPLYCPTDKCPEGYTTCPSSRFPCDVNLQTDRNNCGACGSACPAGSLAETFECIDGRCVLTCDPAVGNDCDGHVDNGCETRASDRNNCGACGKVCADPAKPCVNLNGANYDCGCGANMLACALDPEFPYCVDPYDDDYNCGACDNACDRSDDGGTPPPNSYYGCVGGQCGHLKCLRHTGDCDSDRPGCETSLTTRENCGACGNVCPDGEDCRMNLVGQYECMCPAGLTYCNARCVDLGTDPRNCGTCGKQCASDFDLTSVGVCSYGTCGRQCVSGRADCNGNPSDGCEVNTNSDPQNCGGCGIVCDAVAGQACVRGRCVVEPCSQPDGGPLAK